MAAAPAASEDDAYYAERGELLLQAYREQEGRYSACATPGAEEQLRRAGDDLYLSNCRLQHLVAFICCKIFGRLTLPVFGYLAYMQLFVLILRSRLRQPVWLLAWFAPERYEMDPSMRLPRLGCMRSLEFAFSSALCALALGKGTHDCSRVLRAVWEGVGRMLLLVPAKLMHRALPHHSAAAVAAAVRSAGRLCATFTIDVPLAGFLYWAGKLQAEHLAAASRRSIRHGQPLLWTLVRGRSRGAEAQRWSVPDAVPVPDALRCPVTLELFCHPCVLHGQVFERDAIEEWLLRRGAHPLAADRPAAVDELAPATQMEQLCHRFALSRGLHREWLE
eukprot:TRINITY_DN14294_c0_g1_i1.p1 TRINITY_DN14294_c0_g1~~TRINITY_DN14294_c0_g1_i1.p1  ORF type:complete len:360 (+),score=117.70 TRINITY_DN14294_c0_g1_i1:80-1081(+)